VSGESPAPARPPGDSRKLLAAAIDRRMALLAAGDLDAVRLVNGEGDRLPGLYLDRFRQVLLVSVEDGALLAALIGEMIAALSPSAVYVKALHRDLRRTSKAEQRPALAHARATSESKGERFLADPEDPEISVRERDLHFLVRPRDGYSPGLFLDQRDNRARTAELVRSFVQRQGRCAVLNTFAYTCAFSVAAAKAAGDQGGVTVTSVDLSVRYLDWGRRNFEANGLDPSAHEFAHGDVLTFMKIAAKKQRRFDLLILDPPTFATSRSGGVFQVERDYSKLFALAAQIAAPGAAILCSHNQRTFTRDALAKRLLDGARDTKRAMVRLEPFAPPADFPGAEEDNPSARGFWVGLD
jgi:23S rRNA (cytosine1962-C5)-methyltransferase